MNIKNLYCHVNEELEVYINNELQYFCRYFIKNTVFIYNTYTECKYAIFGETQGANIYILHNETSKLYMNNLSELQEYTNGILNSFLKYYTNSGIK